MRPYRLKLKGTEQWVYGWNSTDGFMTTGIKSQSAIFSQDTPWAWDANVEKVELTRDEVKEAQAK